MTEKILKDERVLKASQIAFYLMVLVSVLMVFALVSYAVMGLTGEFTQEDTENVGQLLYDVDVNGDDVALVGQANDRAGLFDVSDQTNIQSITELTDPTDTVDSVGFAGDDMAVLGARDGDIHFYDVSNPSSPSLLTTETQPGGLIEFVKYNAERELVFVAERDGVGHLYNVSDPQNINQIDTVDPDDVNNGERAAAFNDNGTHLVLYEDEDGVALVYNITDLASITQVGSLPGTVTGTNDYIWNDDVLYEASSGLRTYDMSDPTSPTTMDSVSNVGTGSMLDLSRSTDRPDVLVGGSSGDRVDVFDISDPSNLSYEGSLDDPTNDATGVAFNATGETLTVSGFDSILRTYSGPEPSVAIENAPASINVSETAQLSAVFTDSDVTDGADWTSNDTDVLTVTDGGLIEGVSEGTAEIEAEYQGTNDTVEIEVNDPIVDSFLEVEFNDDLIEKPQSQIDTDPVQLYVRDRGTVTGFYELASGAVQEVNFNDVDTFGITRNAEIEVSISDDINFVVNESRPEIPTTFNVTWTDDGEDYDPEHPFDDGYENRTLVSVSLDEINLIEIDDTAAISGEATFSDGAVMTGSINFNETGINGAYLEGDEFNFTSDNGTVLDVTEIGSNLFYEGNGTGVANLTYEFTDRVSGETRLDVVEVHVWNVPDELDVDITMPEIGETGVAYDYTATATVDVGPEVYEIDVSEHGLFTSVGDTDNVTIDKSNRTITFENESIFNPAFGISGVDTRVIEYRFWRVGEGIAADRPNANIYNPFGPANVEVSLPDEELPIDERIPFEVTVVNASTGDEIKDATDEVQLAFSTNGFEFDDMDFFAEDGEIQFNQGGVGEVEFWIAVNGSDPIATVIELEGVEADIPYTLEHWEDLSLPGKIGAVFMDSVILTLIVILLIGASMTVILNAGVGLATVVMLVSIGFVFQVIPFYVLIATFATALMAIYTSQDLIG